MNTPSPQTRLPTLILLLIATLGIPSATAIAFADQVTQHPWQWLGWTLLYELLVLIGGVITQVWQKLQSRWVDRVADHIDYFVQSFAPNYRKRYLEHLRYRHCNFDVKGLTTQGVYTLDLQRVFVQLRMAPRPMGEVRADPIAVIPQELRGQKPIWDYLRHTELKNLAILGAPGSGKTTMLKYVALSLASGFNTRNQLQAPNRLPILLFLRDHSPEIAPDANYSLESAIIANLKQKDGPQPPEGWFTHQLQSGKSLLLFDGLDEVADAEKRQKVVQWVEKQMVAYPHCHFVVTSRPHGYRSNPIEGVAVLEVQPFNLKQVEKFVNNWYIANEIMSSGRDDPGVRMEAKSGADDLLKRLRSTATLAELAVNPLMLTMIATVHRYRSSLPGRRVELYAEVCEVFLGKRQASKGLIQALTPTQKQRVLQPLAHDLMIKERREIGKAEAVQVISHPLTLVTGSGEAQEAEEFLKAIENESGLLLEREAGEYSFAHLAFQEYLAAVHIREQRLEETLVGQVNNPWWHETIRLYCAQGDATPIIAACLKDDLPPVLALTLAIECVEEAKEVAPRLRQRLNALLSKGVDDDLYIDTSCISHVEYQLFLDEKRSEGKFHQPDHWQGFDFPKGQGNLPVVGMRPSDAEAFCAWLTQQESHASLDSWQFRLPMAGEVSQHKICFNEKFDVPIGYWIRTKSGVTLETLGSTLPSISGSMLVARIRWAAAFNRALDSDISGLTFNDLLNRALDHTRDHTLDGSLDRTLGGTLNQALDRTLDRILNRTLDRALDLDHILALDLDRILHLALDRTRTRDIDRTRTNVRSNARIEARLLTITPILDRSLDRSRTYDRAYGCNIYILVVILLSDEKDYKIVLVRQQILDLIIDLVILEQRIEGKLPAFEGILIVKERKQEEK